jgi:hypothetical protein
MSSIQIRSSGFNCGHDSERPDLKPECLAEAVQKPENRRNRNQALWPGIVYKMREAHYSISSRTLVRQRKRPKNDGLEAVDSGQFAQLPIVPVSRLIEAAVTRPEIGAHSIEMTAASCTRSGELGWELESNSC